MIDYAEYLRSVAWARRRQWLFRMREFRCAICGIRYPARLLEAHHKTYVRLGNERVSDLAVVCRPCHARIHGEQCCDRGFSGVQRIGEFIDNVLCDALAGNTQVAGCAR